MARTSSHEFGFSKSLEGVSNGIASMLPRSLDTDDEYDYGPKPSELYGTYTWKISNFSEINKSESRSNVFNVGGYKWYILLYHKGFNGSNRISLFLCVADARKLRPGWGHFAHFTLVVENKDPKKSENNNALHRFWQKEPYWGWKIFMILPTLLDGFVEDDTLTIKVRVQVIREIKDRPFRCLESQYKSELIRLYRSHVEKICWDFVEDRKERIEMFIEDEAR